MLHCDSSGLVQLISTCPCVHQLALPCYRASEQYVLLGSQVLLFVEGVAESMQFHNCELFMEKKLKVLNLLMKDDNL